MLINSERVNQIFLSCILEDGVNSRKPPEGTIDVKGVTGRFGLDKGELEFHRAEINKIIQNLPKEFLPGEQGGGGWSFLNLCNDKDGTQWTGFHQIMEELVVLSIGLGLANYCMPSEFWSIMPGGMPYISFNPEPQGIGAG